MPKNTTIGLRLTGETKAAAQAAAKDDHRSLSSLIELALEKYLIEKGYLERPEGHRRDDHGSALGHQDTVSAAPSPSAAAEAQTSAVAPRPRRRAPPPAKEP
jgi:hypothetical protein